jgi:4-hydroxy-L-threonine phosphate dehydrogenase PdxA
MSLINEYRATEEAIKELQDRLAQMQSNDDLKMEMEFEEKLRGLMAEYQKSLRDIIALIDPQRATLATSKTKQSNTQKEPGTRKPRSVKQYKNPHNGEVLETKGGNHKTLKEWKAQYGSDVVESWVTFL